jgi:hypothetical protein
VVLVVVVVVVVVVDVELLDVVELSVGRGSVPSSAESPQPNATVDTQNRPARKRQGGRGIVAS